MKIIITGATGFLGKYVVRELSQTHQLILLGTDLSRLQATFGNRFVCIETDYSVDHLESQLSHQSVDAVVHLAARRVSSSGMFSDYSDNILITENLLRWCDMHHVGRMVMASSQSIYRDDLNIPPFKEEDAYALGVGKSYGYAYSKFICEQLSSFYHTPMISLRFGQLLGWGEKEGFMFMTQLGKVLRNEAIVLWGQGGGGRDYLYCKDAVQAIEKTLTVSEPQTEAYNISMGKPISFKQFAETLVEVFGNAQSRIEYDITKIEDKHIRYMCIEKASRELGWTPSFDLRDAFADMKKEEYEIHCH